MCPLRVGERMACVEPAADSSRNFLVRVVDATSKRHAFLGMGFPERDDAFDFNVALSDWEKHLQGAADSVAAAAAAPQHDFSLKAGETIKVKPIASRGTGGGLMSSMAAFSPDGSSSAGGAGFLAPPMPASATGGSAGAGLLPPVPVPAGGLLAPPPAGISAGSSALSSNPNSSPSSQVGLIALIVPCKLLQCSWLMTAS
jgi:adaptin ear-binding coat-associated protein 1/2